MILIYDVEIIRCIMPKSIEIFPPKLKPFENGLEYCQGWTDFSNMGISIIGCYLDNQPCHFINKDNSIPYQFPDFLKLLEQKPIIVGFNTKKFDDKLLRANKIKIKTDYDLLEEIRRAAYGSTKWDKQPKGHTYTLDAVAKANGMAKTGSGSHAPKLWQEGKRQEVIDYCLNDCQITAEILKLGLEL